MKRRAVVLLNLGTPTDPSPRSVGIYLREFLMDPFVLHMSDFGRWCLVNLLIVPLRKFRSAKLYKKIWTSEGSPLFFLTKGLAEKTRSNAYDTYFAFRYGHPSVSDVLPQLEKYSDVLFVPLYPQEATSSTLTSKVALEAALKKHPLTARWKWIQNFYREPFYIDAMKEIISEKLTTDGIHFVDFDHFIFSFHSLPESHLTDHDLRCETCLQRGHCENLVESCYRNQCEVTAELLRVALGIPKEKLSVTYQSRLGRAKWITPATEKTLIQLASENKRRVFIFAPGFICDCLETLEELDFELRIKFLKAGGEVFVRPRCVNDNPIFTRHFQKFIHDQFEVL